MLSRGSSRTWVALTSFKGPRKNFARSYTCMTAVRRIVLPWGLLDWLWGDLELVTARFSRQGACHRDSQGPKDIVDQGAASAAPKGEEPLLRHEPASNCCSLARDLDRMYAWMHSGCSIEVFAVVSAVAPALRGAPGSLLSSYWWRGVQAQRLSAWENLQVQMSCSHLRMLNQNCCR